MGDHPNRLRAIGVRLSHALLRALPAFACAGVIALAPTTGHAQTAADPAANSRGGETSVAITTPSSLSSRRDLDFGRVITGNSAGSVTVAPDSSVTTAGDVIAMGGAASAEFLLEKSPYADFPTTYSPILPTTIEIVHENDPDAKMTIRDVTSDFNRRRRVLIFSVPAWWGVAEYDFRVGGTLDVASNQKAGVYTGSFTVQVDFQ